VRKRVENAINSRPLTYLNTENVEDALTPYHLIYGRNINSSHHIGGTFANPESEQLSSRVRRVRVVIKHFMTRFQNEYVTNLKELHRYRKTERNYCSTRGERFGFIERRCTKDDVEKGLCYEIDHRIRWYR